ncbi:SUF system Fe-S cluster assembly regulator [bacterium]|nr:SUF system Fe-S cluster assembly regulator [bacterium]
MIRVAKLTDYGIALMTRLAQAPAASATARDLAEALGLPLPTVSKLLKLLARQELLLSQRGAKGGYSLARRPEEITLAELVGALEGRVAVTECSAEAGCACELEPTCDVRENWGWINRQVMSALENVTLREMAGSLAGKPGGNA